MKKNLLLAALALTIAQIIQAKVLVITYAYNRPEFIPLQYQTLKKFLLADYEFVVFNDARDNHLREDIFKTCNELNIACIPIPQTIHDQPYLRRLPGEGYHDASVRCVNVVQYSLDILGFKQDDLVFIMDSDLFLVKPFDIYKYMCGYNISGLAQSRLNDVHYLWIGAVILDIPNLPNVRELNFNCGQINGSPVDAGGHTHDYLKKYATTLHVRYMSKTDLTHHLTACSDTELYAQGFNEQTIQFIKKGIHNTEFLVDGTLFHYRGGTNWDGQSQDYHQKKKSIMDECLAIVLNNKLRENNE